MYTCTHQQPINIYLLIQIHFHKEHHCGIFIFCSNTSSFFLFTLLSVSKILVYRHKSFNLSIILTHGLISFNCYPNWNLPMFCSDIREVYICYIGQRFAYKWIMKRSEIILIQMNIYGLRLKTILKHVILEPKTYIFNMV
jgi:hypothetical protein